MSASGFAAPESALPQLPSLREAGLWGGAAAFVLAAHLGAAYYLRDIEPAPVENAALEQSMEIELAPLVIDTPERVQSETLAEAPPVEEVLHASVKSMVLGGLDGVQESRLASELSWFGQYSG